MNTRPDRRCCVLLYLLVTACASAPQHRPDFMSVVNKDGVTESEIIEALGPPLARYDDNRVLAYRLGVDKYGPYITHTQHDWTGVKDDLILELDNGVLVQHRLIPIRPDSHASATTVAR